MVGHRMMPLRKNTRSIGRTLLLWKRTYVKQSIQYHCMNIITNTINEVNHGQTQVGVCEQPIFALTEEI